MAHKRAPDVKTVLIQVPVSPKERKQFRELADSEHKSLAQLIRELLYRFLEDKQKGVAA